LSPEPQADTADAVDSVANAIALSRTARPRRLATTASFLPVAFFPSSTARARP
jgi:hypothetical protein